MRKEQSSVACFLKISRALWRKGDLLFCPGNPSDPLAHEKWVHEMRILLRQLLSLLDFYKEEEALCRDFFRRHLGKKASSTKDPYAQRKAFYRSASSYDHQKKGGREEKFKVMRTVE